MTQIEVVNQLNEPDFQKEIEMALVKVALPIANDEANPAKGYAKQVINGSEGYVRRFGLALLTEVVVEKATRRQVTDAVSGQVFDTHIEIDTETLEASVTKWFNAFAG